MKYEDVMFITGIVVIVALFIFASYVIQTNLGSLENLIKGSYLSLIIYVLLLILAAVIAPVSALPLLPLAANVWGWALTAILSIIGESIGAAIAFLLARKYGVPLVKKFVSLDKIQKFEKIIPEKNVFFGIIFLRMAVPVDALSYVLGLFSHIKFKTYVIATTLGVTPFSFVFSYLGTLPFYFQIGALFAAVVVILVGLLIWMYKNKRKKARK